MGGWTGRDILQSPQATASCCVTGACCMVSLSPKFHNHLVGHQAGRVVEQECCLAMWEDRHQR